jgi:hypothetical protein
VKRVKRVHWLFTAVLAGLLLAPAALAQSGSTSGSGYLGTAGETQAGVGSGNLGAASQGTLPFTGLDLALLVAGGLALLMVGASVRRLTRSRA